MGDAWAVFVLVMEILVVAALFIFALIVAGHRVAQYLQIQAVKHDYKTKWIHVQLHTDHVERVEALERETTDRKLPTKGNPENGVVEMETWRTEPIRKTREGSDL